MWYTLGMNQEWLDNLKVDDAVVILGRDRDWISTVERFTKTLIITKGGKKFRKNGTSPGSIWDNETLTEPTEERLGTIRRAKLAARLKAVKWKALRLEVLRKIAEIVRKFLTFRGKCGIL